MKKKTCIIELEFKDEKMCNDFKEYYNIHKIRVKEGIIQCFIVNTMPKHYWKKGD